MANPNISLLGATYSEVAGVTLPTQGGGTATFPWVEGSQTITQNGTVDVTNLAEVVVNVSGGGGASNVVTGTFTGTTAGAAMDIDLPYTGSGYPISVEVFPTDGFSSGDPSYSLIQRYAVMHFCSIKLNDESPSYAPSGTNNQAVVFGTYKNSASSSTVMAGSGSRNAVLFSGGDASAGNFPYLSVKFKSKTKMSVFIASTSYGFAANIEYTYHVIYSS